MIEMNDKGSTHLKVLTIIHGYPPYYMAGSEVYTANFCKELSKKAELSIFTRIEDEFQKPYHLDEKFENNTRIIRINKPGRDYTFKSKYQDFKMAEIFENFLVKVKPNIVHIGHLSHLTILIVDVIHKYKIPIIFTLHDYWMMCIRGQLIKDDYTLCNGPSIKKCSRCNIKYFISESQAIGEITKWLEILSTVNSKIDLFIAPSLFLRNKYIEYGIPREKIIYMDYGFDKAIINGKEKIPYKKLRFGFLGRIIPVKGISHLMDAFNKVDHSKAELFIHGRLPASSIYLKNRRNDSVFKGSYNYGDISKVLSNIDVLVVPSIWYENSPLVIHEAFLAKIPVITSNLGGMAELVEDKKNGLLFEPGNIEDLLEKMNKFIENPRLIEKYSQYTYVRSIQEDVREIINLYYKLLKQKEVELIAQ